MERKKRNSNAAWLALIITFKGGGEGRVWSMKKTDFKVFYQYSSEGGGG